jgi:hypothetical protein
MQYQSQNNFYQESQNQLSCRNILKGGESVKEEGAIGEEEEQPYNNKNNHLAREQWDDNEEENVH